MVRLGRARYQTMSTEKKWKTPFTEMMGIRFPLIAAPMFLVSNEDLVSEASEAGAIGTFPALNYRPLDAYAKALKTIRQKTKRPIGVNIIVNKGNSRQNDDLKIALDHGVELFITSLGSPKTVIAEAHKNGAKVLCDVTNLEHALKVQDWGADGVIAVGSGAGGHAGPVSPLVLIPWLKEKLSIPIIAAGGISHGSQIAACLALGAAGVSVGTRFIASKEAQVNEAYKQAIINASPEDIVMTTKISGTPAAVIRTPEMSDSDLRLNPILEGLKNFGPTKKYAVPLIYMLGEKLLEKAAKSEGKKKSWKDFWSAGQSVGLVHDIQSTRQIIERLEAEAREAITSLNGFSPKG